MEKLIEQFDGVYFAKSTEDFTKIVEVLGRIQDMMEKYDVPDLEDLEKRLKRTKSTGSRFMNDLENIKADYENHTLKNYEICKKYYISSSQLIILKNKYNWKGRNKLNGQGRKKK